ncbi:hypothetical protein [Caudoviricetes sp.]|nr:hypothetical protein [Caudoviricetes sp.]
MEHRKRERQRLPTKAKSPCQFAGVVGCLH